MAKERIWKIHGSCTVPNGNLFMDVTFETIAFAEDAGAAWLEFQKPYEGAKWFEISVTEVKGNECGKRVSGTHQVV